MPLIRLLPHLLPTRLTVLEHNFCLENNLRVSCRCGVVKVDVSRKSA